MRVHVNVGELVTPGACFSKVPKLFGRILGDIILLVSLKRRRLEARDFAFILDFIPFTTYEKTSFTEYVGRSFTNGFSGVWRNSPQVVYHWSVAIARFFINKK